MKGRPLVVRRPGEGDHLAVVGDVYRVLAWGEETAGRYALIHATIPPGGGPPPHLHRHDEESFYILSGVLTLFADGSVVRAEAGDFISIPAGAVHNFRNEGDQPVQALITVAPAGLDKFFREVGKPLEPGQAALPPSPEDIERLLEAAPRYGVDLVGGGP